MDFWICFFIFEIFKGGVLESIVGRVLCGVIGVIGLGGLVVMSIDWVRVCFSFSLEMGF